MKYEVHVYSMIDLNQVMIPSRSTIDESIIGMSKVKNECPIHLPFPFLELSTQK